MRLLNKVLQGKNAQKMAKNDNKCLKTNELLCERFTI
jgi:hypothetical protein